MSKENFYLKKNSAFHTKFKHISLAFFSVFILIVCKDYTNITSVKYYSFIGLFYVLVSCYLLEKGPLLSNGVQYQKKNKNTANKFKINISYIGILVFFLVNIIACVFSPCSNVVNGDGQSIFLFGAGRYDGLIVMSMYLLLFLIFSLEGTFSEIHINVITITTLIMTTIGLLQIMGFNVLWFYPNGDYYTYKGSFVSTLGNIDVVSTYLCLAISIITFAAVAFKTKIWIKIIWLLTAFYSTIFLLSIDVLAGRVTLSVLFFIAVPFMFLKKDYLLSFLDVLTVLATAIFVYVFLYYGVKAEYVISLIILVLILQTTKFLFGKFLTEKNLKKYIVLSVGIQVILAIGMVLYLSLLTSFNNEFFYQLSSILDGRAMNIYGSSRYGIWKYTLDLIEQRPWIGYGMGSFLTVFNEYIREIEPSFATKVFDYAHNEYIQILYDSGIIGLVGYMTFLAGLIIPAIKRLVDNPKILVLTFVVLAYLIQATFTFSIVIVSPLFWILAGMLCYEIKHEIS